jgi:hypothetical protein
MTEMRMARSSCCGDLTLGDLGLVTCEDGFKHDYNMS